MENIDNKSLKNKQKNWIDEVPCMKLYKEEEGVLHHLNTDVIELRGKVVLTFPKGDVFDQRLTLICAHMLLPSNTYRFLSVW